MAEGVDVYTKYQQITDFAALARTRQFVYVKVSDGTALRDTGGYGPKGRAVGLKMGGYHYAQPGDPVAQANLFIDACAAALLLDLAPALDIESNAAIHTWTNAEATAFAIAFLRQVKARGHRPCLYANNSMLTAILPAVKAAVPDVIVWAARYGANPTVPFDVHQYDDAGTVSGIRGTVDTNRGTVPLNTSTGTPPVEDQEEDDMSEERGEAVPRGGNEWGTLHVPINGNRYLRIACSYNRPMDCGGISMVGDTSGGSGAVGRTVWGAGNTVAVDRPGPWDLSLVDPDYAKFSHVVIKYQCDGPVKAWTNNRAASPNP